MAAGKSAGSGARTALSASIPPSEAASATTSNGGAGTGIGASMDGTISPMSGFVQKTYENGRAWHGDCHSLTVSPLCSIRRERMSDDPEGTVPSGNRLLAALPPDEYARLAPYLETIALTFKQVLYAPDEPITHIYFPTEGVASLLQFNTDGDAVEVATVGNEGMIGLPVFLGLESTPGQAIVQIVGAGQRIPAAVFQREVPAGTPLHTLLHRYTQAL